MSKLYYTESGHAIPTLGEEVTTFRRARKALTLPATGSSATLYIVARSHPDTDLPLRLSVNGQELAPVQKDRAWYTWYEVEVPPSLIRDGENTFELWCDATAMNAWSLGIEPGHAEPDSAISDDGGTTWRNHHMAYLNAIRGEYLVRVRLAEGEDRSPPNIVFNDIDSPRLESLRRIVPEGARDKTAPLLERVRALSTWLASSWEHTPFGPDLGIINTPWDPETVLDWAPRQVGHNGLRPISNCIFYGVSFANACQAVGIPARCAIFAGQPGKAHGHFTAEYWSQEHETWGMVDPNFDAIFVQDGVPQSVTELQQRGTDLADVTEYGPGAEAQKQNPRVTRWFESDERRALSLQYRAVWYRADQLTHPELSPPAHGGGAAYTETGIVWEKRDKDTWGMFPLFGSPEYFNAPPLWER